MPEGFLDVPVVRQRRDFSCGAAATLALLRYWLPDAYAATEEGALYGPLGTTEARGTEPEPIVAFLRHNGLDARYRHTDVTVADLERAVDAREPPIVDLQAWTDHGAPYAETWDAGHYVLLVGYDDKRLYFVDPSSMTPTGHAFLARGEFDERWHDLAGEQDQRVRRMAVFVRGVRGARPPGPGLARAVDRDAGSSQATPANAVRLG
ncbi:MAG: C39 family peptidase [Polyangiaceae bacterium]